MFRLIIFGDFVVKEFREVCFMLAHCPHIKCVHCIGETSRLGVGECNIITVPSMNYVVKLDFVVASWSTRHTSWQGVQKCEVRQLSLAVRY